MNTVWFTVEYLEALCLPQSNYTYLDLFVKWKVKVIKFLLFFFFFFIVDENATSLD